MPQNSPNIDGADCSGTLHLRSDPAPALREIVRVLRHDGSITGMIVVMTTGPQRHRQRTANETRRATFRGPDALRSSLEAFGLSRLDSKACGGAVRFSSERTVAVDREAIHD